MPEIWYNHGTWACRRASGKEHTMKKIIRWMTEVFGPKAQRFAENPWIASVHDELRLPGRDPGARTDADYGSGMVSVPDRL